MIIRYQSVAALARDAQAKRAYYAGEHADLWHGNESAADSVRLAQCGDTRLVPKAEQILSQIQTDIEIPESMMVADVAGAYPVVAEFLAGAPDCMRRRAPIPQEQAPIVIYACLSSYAGVSAQKLLRRGVAVLALTMALARSRPVELWAIDINDGPDGETTIAARINTSPLDLATAAYALTSAGFVRRLMYGLTEQASGNVNFPAGYSSDPAGYLVGALARLGGNADRDLILPPANNGDPEPVTWINGHIARLAGASQ